jgi:hypothetical protein
MSPKLIFIVPYRDRKEHKHFFTKYMEYILEDYKKEDYEIYFSHQFDLRPFNRGAMKNIGFLAMKQKYPNDYKNITFVFHDVDTMPYIKNLLNYETTPGIIKHFYGYEFALGGIFSIKGNDFEMINGFPNMWGWSMEDNMIQQRAIEKGLKIDRNNFFKLGARAILQFTDGITKIINKKEVAGFLNKDYRHGLNSINKLNFELSNEFINVKNFETETDANNQKYEKHDITQENSSKIRLTKEERYGANNIAIGGFKNMGTLFKRR